MKILRLWALLILLLPLIATNTQAQSRNYYDELEYRRWRVTLFPPISTNGANAVNYTARRSINLIGGYHGALDGWEVGFLFNATKYYSAGFQLAGGVNYTRGDMDGFNIAGLMNISRGSMAGVQFSGIGNFSRGSLDGLQAALGVNYARNSISGLQAAGISNVSRLNVEGLQAAGVFNAANGDISGLQAAGFVNIAKSDVEGLQAAGILNFAGNNISGMQATFGANIALGSMEGLLASGVFNVAKENVSGLIFTGGVNVSKEIEGMAIAGIGNFSRELEGLQFAGVNFAETATGLQIGILNIAKEFEGAPIGILSLYGNGRYNVDARMSDAGFVDFGFTTGTHRVYNMAMFGYNTSLDRDVYRIGLGVGLEKNIQDSFEKIESTTLFVNQEFSVHHVFEDEWDRTLNFIYSYKYMVGNRFGNGLSLYGGPSLNMQVTRVNGSNDYSWYSFWSPSRKGREYQFWVGFTVGLRVFKQKNLPLLDDDFDRWERRWDW